MKFPRILLTAFCRISLGQQRWNRKIRKIRKNKRSNIRHNRMVLQPITVFCRFTFCTNAQILHIGLHPFPWLPPKKWTCKRRLSVVKPHDCDALLTVFCAFCVFCVFCGSIFAGQDWSCKIQSTQCVEISFLWLRQNIAFGNKRLTMNVDFKGGPTKPYVWVPYSLIILRLGGQNGTSKK